MKRTQTKYRIAIVNHASPSEPNDWADDVSVRRSRAVRQVIRMRKAGNRFAMLFEWTGTGLRPLSPTMDYALGGIGKRRDPNVHIGNGVTQDRARNVAKRVDALSLNANSESLADVMVDIIRERVMREVRDITCTCEAIADHIVGTTL